MSTPTDPEEHAGAHWWRARLGEAAAALDARLRAGGVPRSDRASARAALQRAFSALEAAPEPRDGGPAPVLVRLVRETDALASPLVPYRPPALRRPIGPPMLRSAVDAGLVDRVVDYAAHAERLSARIDAFLEATGGKPLRLFVADVRTGERESPEMALTEG
ncbi:hypothetical protein L6V77_15665 [Myxococcota bacterium]|nr:hypothetical protein [Myxococcota bacterium]